MSSFKTFEIDWLPTIKSKTFAVNGGANLPIIDRFFIFAEQMQRCILQIKIKHDWLSPIGSHRTTVGKQRGFWFWRIFGCLGQDMESGLGICALVFEAFMPRTGCKGANCMGSCAEMIKCCGLTEIVNCFVFLVIQSHMDMWPQAKISIFENW
ncbi:hypothetical protein B9G53_00325 [Pseudanabaena sp. SR411]|nr:hypothetical protein B9G53_00325 [Pseudanabaena sp. SR411]